MKRFKMKIRITYSNLICKHCSSRFVFHQNFQFHFSAATMTSSVCDDARDGYMTSLQ